MPAARRYDVVDPTKRHVARELGARWNAALERVARLEERIARLTSEAVVRPRIDRAALMDLAQGLPAAWNAPDTDARTKQRLLRILVQDVVLDLDEAANEAVVVVHWTGARHTQLRVARLRCGRYPEDRCPSSVEVVRVLGGHWPDRELARLGLAVTMNRMRCRAADRQPWTTVRVRELRERLGVAPFDPAASRVETVSADAAAQRLGICVGSVHRLIRDGALPATQLLPSAPWQVPVAALVSEAVRIGVQEIIGRRPRIRLAPQGEQTLTLPGI